MQMKIQEKNESNVFAVIDCIVNKPWNKNKVRICFFYYYRFFR